MLDQRNNNNEPNCPIHGPKKLVPAGISKKTGKKYDAFYVCEICNPKNKPMRPQQDTMLLDELTGLQRKVKELESRLDSAGQFVANLIRINNLKQ